MQPGTLGYFITFIVKGGSLSHGVQYVTELFKWETICKNFGQNILLQQL
jgi:hypothetical protein